MQEALDGSHDLLPESLAPGHLIRSAPLPERTLQRALDQADRWGTGQIGNPAALTAARGGRRLVGRGQRRADPADGVTLAGDRRRGPVHGLAQGIGRQLPTNGFHVLADRIPIGRLPDHAGPSVVLKWSDSTLRAA